MIEYLTPEDFEIAKANGISRKRAHHRFYVDCWSKERAITEPVKKVQNLWTKYKDIAVVSNVAFYERIQKGMSPEQAATKPPLVGGQRHNPPFPIAQEIRELAKRNGIKFITLRNRIYEYGWSPEDAAAIPVGTRRKRKGWR